MGPSQPLNIPWSAATAWGDRHGLNRDEMALLRLCLGAMDTVYREWCAEKAKQKEKE